MRRELEYELFGGTWNGVGFESEAEAELERLLERIDEAVYETPRTKLQAAPGSTTTLQATPCKTAPLTNGNFGLALQQYTNTFCVPNEAIQFLQQSSIFMNMVASANPSALDKQYIPFGGPQMASLEQSSKPGEMKLWYEEWKPRDDGVLTAGPSGVRGRRVLLFRYSSAGSFFMPAESPANRFGSYDIIFLEPPQQPKSNIDEIGKWIELIAHETTHAFHRVSRSGPSPAKMADRIRAAIAEEGETRRTEASIVAEIKKSVAKFKTFQPQRQCADSKFSSLVGANDGAAVVERDFFPSKLQSTYLEQFVLMELIGEAIRNEKLSQEEINRRNSEVDLIPTRPGSLVPHFYVVNPNERFYDFKTKTYRPFTSEYNRRRFWLRVIDERWQRLMNRRSSLTDQDFEAAKERFLQQHARAFFRGVISYTPRPKQTP